MQCNEEKSTLVCHWSFAPQQSFPMNMDIFSNCLFPIKLKVYCLPECVSVSIFKSFLIVWNFFSIMGKSLQSFYCSFCLLSTAILPYRAPSGILLVIFSLAFLSCCLSLPMLICGSQFTCVCNLLFNCPQQHLPAWQSVSRSVFCPFSGGDIMYISYSPTECSVALSLSCRTSPFPYRVVSFSSFHELAFCQCYLPLVMPLRKTS